jgi:hypothetical protein
VPPFADSNYVGWCLAVCQIESFSDWLTVDGTYALSEPGEAYRGQFDGESDALRAENTLPWKRIAEIAET